MTDTRLTDTCRPGGDRCAGPDVIPLHRAQVPAGDATPERLEAYWTRLARDGVVPRRADIDPRAIDTRLADVFLIERVAPGLARFRVAGAGFAELMNMDVRGMPLSTLILPGDRDDLAAALTALFDRPAKLRLGLRAAPGVGRARLTGRMLLLPLRADTGEVSRAIGCLVKGGPAGRAPRRFAITGTRVEPIGQIPADRLHPPRPDRTARPHLRLVVTD